MIAIYNIIHKRLHRANGVMSITLSLLFHLTAAKFSNLVQKKNPPSQELRTKLFETNLLNLNHMTTDQLKPHRKRIILTTDHHSITVYYSLVPRPKRRRKGLVSAVRAHALNYLGFNHVLISGRVPMTPSKSHGRLHDVTIPYANFYLTHPFLT